MKQFSHLGNSNGFCVHGNFGLIGVPCLIRAHWQVGKLTYLAFEYVNVRDVSIK